MDTLKKASLKWYGIAVLLLLVFLFITPLSLHNSLGFWSALVESLICALIVFMGIMEFENFNDIFYYEDYKEKLNEKSSAVYIPIASLILGAILLYFILDNRLDNEIDKNGVFTSAIIIDGQRSVSKSIRRQTETNQLTISFKSQEGRDYTFNTKISREIFESVSKGLVVEIKYLPQNPSIFKLMVGNENVKKFKNIPNRNLAFTDLEKLLEMDNEAASTYLNSISEGWTQTKDQNGHLFNNSLKNELVAISNTGEIVFRGEGITQPDSFIPRDKVLNKSNSTQEGENGYKARLTTFELEKIKIIHIFAIKNTDIEISMVFAKK